VRGAPVDEENEMSDQDVDDFCAALVFLATHGFVYTDFRPPNVIRSEEDGRIRLIDYDDMKVVSHLSCLEREYEKILIKITGPGFNKSARSAINKAIDEIKGDEKCHL
jgi:hypothetical protein